MDDATPQELKVDQAEYVARLLNRVKAQKVAIDYWHSEADYLAGVLDKVRAELQKEQER